MLPRLHNVARTLHRLPQPFRRQLQLQLQLQIQASSRSFTTTPRCPAHPAAEHRIDSYIQSALDDMSVHTPSNMPKTPLSLPKSADPSSLVAARFAPGQHVVKPWDRAILTPLTHARSVQRLAHYRSRGAEQPLWIDWLVIQAGCSPVVVSLAKRRMRLALRLALGVRGVHKYGWKREAVERAWAANRAARFAGKKATAGAGVGAVVTPQELDVLRREARVPMLTGSVWVTIKKPKELVLTPFARLRQIADRLVSSMLEKHGAAGKQEDGTRKPKNAAAGKLARKAGKPSRASGGGDLDAEFGDLGAT
ncbi:hypothetical protein ACHAQH_003096 [Verticillium albo-atrum]